MMPIYETKADPLEASFTAAVAAPAVLPDADGRVSTPARPS